MRRAARLVLWSAVALFAAGVSPAQDRPAAQPKQLPVMVRKLTHAQKVLEALAREDYDLLRTHADGLAACVKDATWRINDTERYLLFSNDFAREAASLQKAAKDKRGDAATLAFIDMTLTCVKCHRYLRDEGIVRVPDLGPLAPRARAAE
ncbi:hypothetical protein J0H58_30715 [bacterium]|nr:hypothetical protein [bacterium]